MICIKLVIILLTFINSSNDTTNYYLSKSTKGFIYTSNEYILAEKKHDSLTIWVLNNNYNAGFYIWKEKITLSLKPGSKDTQFELIEIRDNFIKTKFKRGHEVVNIKLKKQTSYKAAHRILNIIQSIHIREAYEIYIHKNAKKAEKNMRYLGDNYHIDENAEKMNPKDFEIYFSNKIKHEAENIIFNMSTK